MPIDGNVAQRKPVDKRGNPTNSSIMGDLCPYTYVHGNTAAVWHQAQQLQAQQEPAFITPNNKLSAFQHWHQHLSQLQQSFITPFGPNEAEPYRTSIHLCNGQADLQANHLIKSDMQGCSYASRGHYTHFTVSCTSLWSENLKLKA